MSYTLYFLVMLMTSGIFYWAWF